MNISQTQAASPAAGANANARGAAEATPEKAAAITSDFETFLKLLTTQMQNQDPLNPIESQDFAVQLATFSNVEQQVRTNEILEGLASGLGTSGVSQLAGWVGMEARVAAPIAFDGTPVTIAPTPAPASDAAILVVQDAYGQEVAREAVPLGVETIEWAGVGPTGAPLPPGQYRLMLESVNQGEVTDVGEVAHYAMVTEARMAGGGVEVVLSGGVAVASDAVSGLRAPQAV